MAMIPIFRGSWDRWYSPYLLRKEPLLDPKIHRERSSVDPRGYQLRLHHCWGALLVWCPYYGSLGGRSASKNQSLCHTSLHFRSLLYTSHCLPKSSHFHLFHLQCFVSWSQLRGRWFRRRNWSTEVPCAWHCRSEHFPAQSFRFALT